MRRGLVALLSGLIFALGLALSGMTQPEKIIGFLDLTGRWDPSLALVMVGAVAVYSIAHAWSRRLAKPRFAEVFSRPAQGTIEARLLVGSALFGVGWGLAGYCPGPAVVSLGRLSEAPLLFVATMLLGMGVTARLLERER